MNNFIVFIIILFIAAAILRIDFFFTVVYLFAGVYILSRAWTRRTARQITCTRTMVNRAFLGDEVEVKITVSNKGWLPALWVMVHDSYPLSLSQRPFFREVISLNGNAAHTFSYRLTARRRGFYQIGPTVLQTGDLLGLNQQDLNRVEAEHLIIYPKIKTMRELGLPTHSPQVVLPTPIPIFEDPSRILGVRPYTWGDNPRHIHWTASAATRQVMVKQFQPAIARDSAIFLNLTRADYDRAERDSAMEIAIIAAASLANHMIMREQLPVGLDVLALDPLTQLEQHFKLPPRKERAQLLQILEVLARVQPVDRGQFLENIRQQAVHLTWGATLIIITNQESEPLLHTLLWLKQSGFSPTLLLISPVRKRHLTNRLQFPIYEIWGEQDIELWSQSL